MPLTLTQIKYIVVAIVLALVAYIVYDKIYDYGYSAAEQKYSKIIKEYNDRQTTKTQEIETKISSLLVASSAYNYAMLQDINAISRGLSGKTLVVYKDGKCTLSQEFIDGRATAINRANQR